MTYLYTYREKWPLKVVDTFYHYCFCQYKWKKPLRIVPQHTGNCSWVPGGRLVLKCLKTLKEKLGRKENWKTALKLTPEDSEILMWKKNHGMIWERPLRPPSSNLPARKRTPKSTETSSLIQSRRVMKENAQTGVSLWPWAVSVCQHVCAHTSLCQCSSGSQRLFEKSYSSAQFSLFFPSLFHVFSAFKKPVWPLERRKLKVFNVFYLALWCSQNSQCGSSGLIWTLVDLQTWRVCPFFPIGEGVEVMQDRKLSLLSYLTTQKLHWCSSSELSEFPPAFWWDLGFMCLPQGSQFIMSLMVLSGLPCKVRLAGSVSLEVTVWRSGKHLSVTCFIESRMLFPRLSCMT